MEDWDQFQHQMDLDIPESLDLNEICKYKLRFTKDIQNCFSKLQNHYFSFRFTQRGKTNEHNG